MAITRPSSQVRVVPQVTLVSAARPAKRRSEDLVGVLGPYAWLLDGTSPRGSSCDRDGAWYVQRLGSALATTLGGDSRDLQEALEAALAIVAQEHAAGCGGANQAAGPSSTVLIVRHQDSQLDFLLLGDSALLLETDQGVSHHSDKRLASVAPELRRRIRQRLGAGHGYESEAHRGLVEELVAAERAVRNTDDGYWIASFDPRAARHSLTGSYTIGAGPSRVRRAALLSDGLERAVTVLGLCASWEEIMQALIVNDPSALIQQVREAEAADPTGQRHPRTAASDDASAVLIEFVAEATHPDHRSEEFLYQLKAGPADGRLRPPAGSHTTGTRGPYVPSCQGDPHSRDASTRKGSWRYCHGRLSHARSRDRSCHEHTRCCTSAIHRAKVATPPPEQFCVPPATHQTARAVGVGPGGSVAGPFGTVRW